MAAMRPAACVMGWPVKHSRAPIIHGYWIEKHQLDADFRLEAVPPAQFPDFLASLAERGYVGASWRLAFRGGTIPRLHRCV